MAATIFIDGEAGTTGLEIRARLEGRDDIALLHLTEETRKDTGARAQMLDEADLAILCLPAEASREAAQMVTNPETRLIDASIAFRTDPGWTYGMAELAAGQEDAIGAAKRVTNPGCYACAAIAMLRPLVEGGLLPADFPVTINAVSGYSGGGKKLIDAFENAASENHIDSAYYLYGLDLEHKHTEEMRVHGKLTHRPLFVPSVGRFAKGMVVSLPLQLWALPGKPTAAAIHGVLAAYYAGRRFVSVAGLSARPGFEQLDPESLNGTNMLALHVFGNEPREQAVVAAVLDNLGKGASGQAVQNMNLMLGFDEAAGLA